MSERNGIPQFGLGTFGLDDQKGLDALASAIDAGYRHFDTAQSYGTEANVGTAVNRSELDRNSVFVTTKIKDANLGRISESIDESLNIMGLDYLDLVLIHWPSPKDRVPVRDYIRSLAEARDSGRCRLIGVSNFTRRHIDEAVAELGAGQIATNQVERHLFLQNHILADHCADHDIAVTAYLPIAKGQLDDAPALDAVAGKHDAAKSQIALAYLLALDSIVIPKSSSPERQIANRRAIDIALDAEDMAALRELDSNRRYVDPAGIAPDWD